MRHTWPVLVLIGFLTQFVNSEDPSSSSSPPTPEFPSNYVAQGVLSLPYAELNEPFRAWYDKEIGMSRTDYYGDLYQVYQFGPQKTTSANDDDFGVMYKLLYVPASFHPEDEQHLAKSESLVERVRDAIIRRLTKHNKNSSSGGGGNQDDNGRHLNDGSKTQTRQACFAVKGSVGNTIEPQTVLPSLSDFEYENTGRCPHVNGEHKHQKCELWKLITNVGDKRNTYKMWIRRADPANPKLAIPVHYYMLGYDSLLGSHYDRYDISYYGFAPNAAKRRDFEFNFKSRNCGPMPGPGEDQRERRSNMVAANPIHEYVTDPHRYDHIDHEFEKFGQSHNKEYEHDASRRRSWYNFLHNFRFINGKNRQLKDYKLGVNRFADNNIRELAYLRGRLRSSGYNGGLDYAKHHSLLKGANGQLKDTLPDTWDWSIRGAVTPVKDQAVCGSCWSFGTSGTVEGAYFVKTGKLPRLSQQQMIDCSWKYGNNGCDGGEDFRAYKYILDAGGLATEDDYGSYMGIDGKCHDNDVEKAVKISGFYNVTSNDAQALQHALINYGPVTVAIDASQPTFTFYSHGVYYDEKCNSSPDGLDHQVLVVGYAKIDGKFVWLVKNSWSTYWGNNGYILMSAEKNNCGVMDSPTVPIIKV